MLQTQTSEGIVIRGARVIDPYSRRDERADIAIIGGRYAQSADSEATTVIEADGLIACPGLADIHVHLREPGGEHKETIETGTRAAASGGFTFVAAMPNTTPAADQGETIELVLRRAAEANACTVGPVAAITIGRSGERVTDFAALRAAGAIAFSDDGDGVEDDAVMREAFVTAREVGAVLIQHCEYQRISAGGVMHEGTVSRRLGLRGLNPRSEEAMIERDLKLCRQTGARYHVAHISTAKAVALVRQAKAQGLPVTTEVCAHHLILTDEACAQRDPNTKMHPPLRPRSDVDACRAGLLDGTIDCIVTDHAPHAAEDKARGFLDAPPGIVGLETAVGVAVRAMIDTGLADWPDLIRWMTVGPDTVLSRRPRPITPGDPADLTLVHPTTAWTVDATRFESKSHNTPFHGWTLTGRSVATIRGATLQRPSLVV